MALGQINATFTPSARATLERFLHQANVRGAVLALFKSDGDPELGRWSYAVYGADRVAPLRAAMESRGHILLHALDGLTVAISNVHDARELQGVELDLDGPGYLVARPPVP